MATFLATLVGFAVIIAAMALGVMLTGRRLRGSCGGVEGNCTCSAEKRAKCKEKDGGGVTPHAEVPIEPSQLTRSGRG